MPLLACPKPCKECPISQANALRKEYFNRTEWVAKLLARSRQTNIETATLKRLPQGGCRNMLGVQSGEFILLMLGSGLDQHVWDHHGAYTALAIVQKS
jgi:hypothetical protein